MTIDGRRRTITKRETIATRMVDKSASADPRATKMLIDTMKGVEQRAGEPGGSGEAAAAKLRPPSLSGSRPSRGGQLGTPTECRRKIEMSPGVQSRDDTPLAADTPTGSLQRG